MDIIKQWFKQDRHSIASNIQQLLDFFLAACLQQCQPCGSPPGDIRWTGQALQHLQPGDRTPRRVVSTAEKICGKTRSITAQTAATVRPVICILLHSHSTKTAPINTLVRFTICKHLTIRRSTHSSGISFSKQRVCMQAKI